ncbi:MAG: helix-turn-helix domain-containing protein [Actinomycetota bacterium]
MLEPLGMSALEEGIYRLLIDQQALPAAGIAKALGAGARETRAALGNLEAKGLVSRSPSARSDYVPVSPDMALKVLLLRREEETERLRGTVDELAAQFRASLERRPPTHVVELVRGRESVLRRFEQLQESAREEIVMLDRPPYAMNVEENPGEIQALRRGVRYRVIYDRLGVQLPKVLEVAELHADAGELGRVLTDVPLKLAIADRRVAIVPVIREEPGIEGVIVVHESALLDAIAGFFEMLWAKADPLGAATRSDPDLGGGGSPAATDAQILDLLALGMKDQAIARLLGVTLRTVARRVKRLMEDLGADTRFQAGMRAVQRGAIPVDARAGERERGVQS